MNKQFTYATVCSGIEAPTVAWHKLGWQAAWFSEIEAFPSAVLAHHYPDVPNLGDMTKIHETETFKRTAIDLLCGGTPCQSFSVAGLRKGLADPRGNLMLTFLALINEKQPRWVVWENVPGVLSSWSDAEDGEEVEGVGPKNGRDVEQTNDFDTFLGGLRELGYGIAWRILDAQYYGVAQRRRRVFVVGCLGNEAGAQAVLFERYSLSGHPAPSREARQDHSGVAGTLTSNGGGLSRPAGNANELDFCIPQVSAPIDANYGKGHGVRGSSERPLVWTHEVAPTLTADYGDKQGADNQHIDNGAGLFVCYGIDEECNVSKEHFGPLLRGGQGGTRQVVAYRTAGDGAVYEEGAKTAALTTNTDPSANIVTVYDPGQITSPHNRSNPEPGLCHTLSAQSHVPIGVFMAGQGAKAGSIAYSEHTSPTLKASDCGSNRSPSVHVGLAVRRLTPVECERLQGFPDNYTRLPNWTGWRALDDDETPEELIAEGLQVKQNKKTGKWRVNDVDGPRYKSLGNSMAEPVVNWIGSRIQMVDNLLNSLA